MTGRFDARPGEIRLTAPFAPHDQVTFIGHIESPWSLDDCPKNLRQARERGQGACLHLAPPFRPGLEGIAPGDALWLLYWMAHAPRDLIRQAPRHRADGAGTFALRSPARPNPIGLGLVHVLAIDPGTGRVQIDAIDAVNDTPLIDIKPCLPSVDTVPDAGGAG